MFHFSEHKHLLSLKKGFLHNNQKPVDFSRDPEIIKSVSLINQHPQMCTFTSCQGHFKVAIPTPNQQYPSTMIEIFALHQNSFYFLNSESRDSKMKMELFTEIFPKVDLAKLPFYYQSGWVRILFEESEKGEVLKNSLHTLVSKSKLLDITTAFDQDDPKKSFDLIVGFTPNLKGYTKTSSNQYMNIPWSDIPKLDRDRLKAISLIETWAQERLTN